MNNTIDHEVFREQQRRKFLELKFSYETQLDEKDREIKRHETNIMKYKKQLETKFLIRKQLEESIKTLEMENEDRAKELHKISNLGVSTKGDLFLENKNLQETVTALRLDLENQTEAHSIELSKLKQDFKTKRSALVEGWQNKHAELMLSYERLRGAKMDVKQELIRARELLNTHRLDSEDKIRDVESRIIGEENQKYSNTLSTIDRNILDQEKTVNMIKEKMRRQDTDLSEKRENMLATMRDLENDVYGKEAELVEKRLEMAKLHNENQKLGIEVKVKKGRIENLEVELRDLRNLMDSLPVIEKEKRDLAQMKSDAKKSIFQSTKDHQHAKILGLERLVREAEIRLQKRKAQLQKMAEILSMNVNRVIADTLGNHKLQVLTPIPVRGQPLRNQNPPLSGRRVVVNSNPVNTTSGQTTINNNPVVINSNNNV